jgi:hypothetical protein
LEPDYQSEAESQVGAVAVGCSQGDFHSLVDQQTVEEEDNSNAHHAGFFANYRQNKVSMWLWQIEKLLLAGTQTNS